MLWIHTPLSWGYHESFPNLRNPRIKARLRLPEAYRSLATSFVGSWCQGIPTCTLLSLTISSHENPSSRRILTPYLSKNFAVSPRPRVNAVVSDGYSPNARRAPSTGPESVNAARTEKVG